ncbi:hypothetical protein BgiMline_032164 [Biomphalaria glabrata]
MSRDAIHARTQDGHVTFQHGIVCLNVKEIIRIGSDVIHNEAQRQEVRRERMMVRRKKMSGLIGSQHAAQKVKS